MYEFYGPAGDTSLVRSRIRIIGAGGTRDGAGLSADGVAVVTGAPMTLSTWCVADTITTANGATVSVGQKRFPTSNRYDDYQIGYAGGGTNLNARYRTGASVGDCLVNFTTLASAGRGITSGDLFHLAGVFYVNPANTLRGIIELYVNGRLESTAAPALTRPENNATVIAAGGFNRTVIGCVQSNLNAIGNDGGENYWNGKIGEVAIWNARLNANEISALAKGFSPTQIRRDNLKLYMPLAGERNIVVGSDYQASLEIRAAAPTERPHPMNDHPQRYG